MRTVDPIRRGLRLAGLGVYIVLSPRMRTVDPIRRGLRPFAISYVFAYFF